MSDRAKLMKAGILIAAAIIVIRIVLEQAGAPEMINNIFGVAWLYIIFPVLFALGIRARGEGRPYAVLLRDVVLFAVCTRLMVMVTYMPAYHFSWKAPRFSTNMGGNVGANVDSWNGLFLIPVRNAFMWVVAATIVGIIAGSAALLLKRRTPPSAASA